MTEYLFPAASVSETNFFFIILQGVKQLVSSGANINARSKESKNHTALHEAVIGGHKEVAQYLLQMGANQVRIHSSVSCLCPPR